MGGRSAVVNPTSRGGEAVRAEQAVFTSIRSPMGEGYRIIAASPGIRPDEKAEIIRRAPSHDSLCESGRAAVGLLAFPFESGRYCLGFSCHAGREHTARGGNRVYSHFAVVEPGDWQSFGFNAVRLHTALRHAIGTPLLASRPRL
ncbi:MAG: hypothetical protein O7F76_09135, partial [Planctomycetota bacterium]|nr:hypothetical protein [Planctomycetota bacterium]